MKLFVETHMQNEDRRKGVQQLVDNQSYCGKWDFNNCFSYAIIIILNLLTGFSFSENI
jgi:hypothetical protein